MTLLFLLNPKSFDPGSVIDAVRDPHKRHPKVPDHVEIKKSPEIEQKLEKFDETSRELAEITKRLSTPTLSADLLEDAERNHDRIMRMRWELAKTILEMEEEELITVMLLLES